MRWTTYLTVLTLALSWAGTADAQTTVTVPSVSTRTASTTSATAPASYPPPGSGAHTLHFLSQGAGSAAKCFCNSCVGQFIKNALKPLKALLGGGIAAPGAPIVAAAGGASGTAAKIQAEQAGAKARRDAVRFLGTVDCHYYPEAEAALISALRTDRSECVRWEAAMALSHGCCCTKATTEALRIAVSGSEKDGNPGETSPRVRISAFNSLQGCLSRGGDVSPGSMQRPEPASAQDVAPGEDQELALSPYYQAINQQPQEQLLQQAQATMAQVRAVSATQQVPITLASGTRGPTGSGSLLGLWVRASQEPVVRDTVQPVWDPAPRTMLAGQAPAAPTQAIYTAANEGTNSGAAAQPIREVEYSASREPGDTRLILEGDVLRLPHPAEEEGFQPPAMIPDSSLPGRRARLY